MRALPFGPRDGQRHRVPAVGTPPRPAHAARISRRIAGGPHPQPWRAGLRDNEIPDTAVPAFVPRDVHLQTVRMDVVRLVVEAQRWRASGPNAQLGLHDLDRQVECVVVPGRVRDGGKVVRAWIGLFAAAILILELEPERLAGIKTVERSVERRGRGHPQRGAHDRRRLFELQERGERGPPRARPPEPEPPRAPSGFPAQGPGGVAAPPARLPFALHLPRPTSHVPAKCQGSSSTCSLRLASSITSSKYAGPATTVRVISP